MRALAIVLLSVGVAAAQPAPDREKAKALYQAAEQAVQAGRFEDAIRDYSGAYDLTHDPVLFYKIGSANERAGKCDVALIYYERYLKEAKDTAAFVEQTREHIRACGGDDRDLATGSTTPTPSPTPPAAAPTPSPAPTPTADAAAPTPTADAATPTDTATPTADAATPTDAATPNTDTATPTADTALAAPGPTKGLPARHRAAWLLVAGSVALVTVGGVLAYSASSAENDVRDLYIGLDDRPPAFDPRTQHTYDGLIEEGHRYERLAWLSFGLAGAAAVTAGVLFWRDREAPPVQVAPTANASGAGVSFGGRF